MADRQKPSRMRGRECGLGHGHGPIVGPRKSRHPASDADRSRAGNHRKARPPPDPIGVCLRDRPGQGLRVGPQHPPEPNSVPQAPRHAAALQGRAQQHHTAAPVFGMMAQQAQHNEPPKTMADKVQRPFRQVSRELREALGGRVERLPHAGVGKNLRGQPATRQAPTQKPQHPAPHPESMHKNHDGPIRRGAGITTVSAGGTSPLQVPSIHRCLPNRQWPRKKILSMLAYSGRLAAPPVGKKGLPPEPR